MNITKVDLNPMLEPKPDTESSERFLEFITAGLSPEQRSALLDSQRGASIIEDLSADGYLASGAARTWDMVERGYLSLKSPEALFTNGGLERLRADLDARRAAALDKAPQRAPRPIMSGRFALPGRGVQDTLVDDAAPRPEPIDPRVGQVFGKCLLIEEVGRGATAAVFRAFHNTLKIQVAVKVLLVNRHASREDLDLIRHEAELLAQLDHQNIVRIMDLDEQGGRPYLVLEYVHGITLRQLIAQSGSMRPLHALRVGIQVARGLEYARSRGVIHRDIKPDNILLTREGIAKIADLGIAQVLGRVRGELEDGPLIVGTPAYMAPEQARGEPRIDHRADMFGLGATLFHCMTGEKAFKAATLPELIRQRLNEDAIPAAELNPAIDARTSRLISRLMARDPNERFDSYPKLLRAMRALFPAEARRAGVLKADDAASDSADLASETVGSRAGISGSLSVTSLAELVQFLNFSAKTGLLRVATDVGEATVVLRDGEVWDARFGEASGEDAFLSIIRHREGDFELYELSSEAQHARTVHRRTLPLLMDALRALDEDGGAS